MKCPHCEKEISGALCPNCGSTLPADSCFCMECGARLKEPRSHSPEQEEGLDFENRILCPDGSCTGIIVDGRCTECGKPHPEAGRTAG